MLLAFFSRPGENYHYGDRIDLDVGNTEVVCNMIASAITVDVYRIEAADPYAQDYEATVGRNKREQDDDARPTIAGQLPVISDYDTLLLGSPIWNERPPTIMHTFLDQLDVRGKAIYPFVTYAVSGMGNTAREYERACPDSTIGEGLAVRGEEVRGAIGEIESWLRQMGLSTK